MSGFDGLQSKYGVYYSSCALFRQNREQKQENLEEKHSSEIDLNKTGCKYSPKFEENSDEDSPDPTQQDKPKGIETIADVIHHRDFGYLNFDQATGKAIVPDALRIEIVEKGSIYFQNTVGPFAQKNNRSMTSAWFIKQLGKGKRGMVNRSWLVYSPLKRAAFCFLCLLFPSKDAVSSCSLETESGLSSWKKPEKVTAHVNSQRHRNSFTTWKEMERRLMKKERLIDSQLQNQIATEKEKWRQILKRVLCCIQYLAKQNLAPRGHRESVTESQRCSGNLIELLKLITEFDPIMQSHLSYVQQYPESTTYLSPEIQNEFIQILAAAVREKLVCDIQRAKYYGILFDSTPDAANQEQMSETIRYVDTDFQEKTVVIKECFLGFIQSHKKDAASIAV
ncbi:Zinc finger MYM-type protein 1, partial [Stegodyphus mimosarum]